MRSKLILLSVDHLTGRRAVADAVTPLIVPALDSEEVDASYLTPMRTDQTFGEVSVMPSRKSVEYIAIYQGDGVVINEEHCWDPELASFDKDWRLKRAVCVGI